MNPSLIVVVGAIIAALGAYLNERKKSAGSDESARKATDANNALQEKVREINDLTRRLNENDVKKTELLQSIAARFGDTKQRDEMIRMGARLLTAEGGNPDRLAAEIISNLPKRKDDYVAVEKAKADAYQSYVSDFKIKWEPFIRSAILGSFDGIISELQKSGRKFNVAPPAEFPLTNEEREGRSAHEIRRVAVGDITLRILYETLLVDEGGSFSPAVITIEISPRKGGMMRIDLGLDAAELNRNAAPGTPQARTVAATNGLPDAQFVAETKRGIANLIEKFVIMSEMPK